jgi:rhodanese-related sulfurtransferase
MQSQMKLVDPAKAREYFQDKIEFTTGPVELNRMIKEGQPVNVIDVREAGDFEEAHIPGATNLPHDKWESFEGLSKDKVNILYCYTQQCHLAANAAVLFAGAGFPVMEMDGGFEAWKDNDLETDHGMTNRLKDVADRLFTKH